MTLVYVLTKRAIGRSIKSLCSIFIKLYELKLFITADELVYRGLI